MKLFSVKLISLAVILYKLYDIQERATAATERLEESGPSGMNTCDGDNADACGVGLRCCDDVCAHRLSASYLVRPLPNTARCSNLPSLKGRCVPICEENEMGMIFYRLVMTNGFILLIQEVLQALVVSKCFENPPSLDAAKFFVDIIDTQVWPPPSERSAMWCPVLGACLAWEHRCSFATSLRYHLEYRQLLCEDLVGIVHLRSSCHHLQCRPQFQHAIQPHALLG